MEKKLPRKSIKYYVLSMKGIVALLFIPIILSTLYIIPVHAATTAGSTNTNGTTLSNNPDAAAAAATLDVQQALTACQTAGIDPSQCYIPDSDVQFAGNVAARARDLLNWVLVHYQWVDQNDSQANTFSAIWIFVRNIVYATLGLCVLAAAFLLIITRGKSLTVRKFIPMFIFVAILVTLSFSLVQFFYNIGDGLQKFFLTKPGGGMISNDDLLHVNFDYLGDFGYRLAHPKYDEAVFMTILMTKLTAITYYTMFAILIIRKIIMWFFLVVSPIFPLLLLFPLIRNSAKIWIGEFFRWLLYGPLFAVFLAGLVALWSATNTGANISGIPLSFHCNPTDQPVYPTATAILLGGPCQSVDINNNLNVTQTFVEYIVALLMLWAVIILPFILLKIFLDYYYNFSVTESNIVKYLARVGAGGVINKYGAAGQRQPGYPRPPTPGSPGLPPSASTGLAKNLPTFEHSTINDIERNMAETAKEQQTTFQQQMQPATAGLARQIEEQVAAQNAAGAQAAQSAQAAASQPAISQAALNIEANVAAQQAAAEQASQAAPAETSAGISQTAQTPLSMVITADQARNESISSLYPKLTTVFDSVKTTITEPVERITQQFKEAISDVLNVTNLKIPTLVDVARFDSEVTTKESAQQTETSKVTEIINRIAGVSPIATPVEKQQYAGIREKLVAETKKGNSLAYSILSAAAPKQAPINEVNLVQQVNLDDYEAVKKLWKENYSKANPPLGPDGQPQDRKAWLKEELKKIPQVIDLLLSGDPQKVAQGKEMVNKILPFLLLGGFSKAEIIAYLKAKLEAAKEVMNEVLQVEQDEENKVEVDRKEEVKPKAMEVAAELPDSDDLTKNPPDNGVNKPTEVKKTE